MLALNDTKAGVAADQAEARRADVAALNARFRHHGATSVLEAVLCDQVAGRMAMVSSFGAESVVLLHLVALADRTTPVLFIDTRLLFAETLVYQQDVAEQLRLTDIRVIRADEAILDARDPYGALKFSDKDACCALRKTDPLNQALRPFDGWITGRKRFQNSSRARLEFFEYDAVMDRVKVNPLAHYAPKDLAVYMEENRLPRHPLVAKGYPSIGCMPCTTQVSDGEDTRAGRWRDNDKEECGIHFVEGRAARPT